MTGVSKWHHIGEKLRANFDRRKGHTRVLPLSSLAVRFEQASCSLSFGKQTKWGNCMSHRASWIERQTCLVVHEVLVSVGLVLFFYAEFCRRICNSILCSRAFDLKTQPS